VEVRRAAAESLAASRASDAIEPLLKAWQDEPVRRDATLALAATPDVRALDAYLAGLDSADATLRQRCREAIKGISGRARPLVEAKLDTQKFSAQAIADLQSVFLSHQPVRDWRVLGPIPSEEADPFPLTDPNLQPRGSLKRADGKELRWRTVRARGPEGVVDLGSDSRSEAYAYAEVQSDAERTVELRVGSDDRMTLYVNGQKVHEDLNDSGWALDEATVPAKLRAGRNVILAKVGNSGGGWMFSVAVSGEQKGKLFQYVVKSLDPAAYEDYATRNAGDASRGVAVFNNVQGAACAKCHQVNGQGGEVGPALTGVGAKYDRAKLIESVLYPSRQIFDGYQQTLVRTRSGDTYAGAVRGETQDDLTLIDAENKKHVIKKSDVDRRKTSELSLMPEGLHSGLKPQEFADLIAYLESLKEPGQQK
jgi:putative heme-binding domain-containing protein